MDKKNRILFLGCHLDNLDMDETINYIDSRIAKGIFTQHVVVNVAKLVSMQKNKELFNSVNNSDIINIDGMGVVWGANILGYKIKERVAGIDLFQELLELSSKKISNFFIRLQTAYS